MLFALVYIVPVLLEHLWNFMLQLRAILAMLACSTDNFINVVVAVARVRREAICVQIHLNLFKFLFDYLLCIVNVLEMQVHALVQIVHIVVELLENG